MLFGFLAMPCTKFISVVLSITWNWDWLNLRYIYYDSIHHGFLSVFPKGVNSMFFLPFHNFNISEKSGILFMDELIQIRTKVPE